MSIAGRIGRFSHMGIVYGTRLRAAYALAHISILLLDWRLWSRHFTSFCVLSHTSEYVCTATSTNSNNRFVRQRRWTHAQNHVLNHVTHACFLYFVQGVSTAGYVGILSVLGMAKVSACPFSFYIAGQQHRPACCGCWLMSSSSSSTVTLAMPSDSRWSTSHAATSSSSSSTAARLVVGCDSTHARCTVHTISVKYSCAVCKLTMNHTYLLELVAK